MAIPANAGDKYKVVVHGRIEGQVTNNVWYFEAKTNTDDVTERLINAVWECIVDNLIPVLSAQWQAEKLTYQRVSPTLGPEEVFIPLTNLQGQGNAQALPSFGSAVVSLRTAQGGRSHRGRFYLPGIPEAATQGSTLDPANAFWLGLVGFCLCMAGKHVVDDPAPQNSFQWMVYSRKLGGSTLPYGAAGFTAVTGIVPQSLIGTTRSRKVGRGS